MKATWDRIHAWLEENAPAGYGDLRPGASEEAIRAAEEAMELTLPDDVKASYRIHDGQEGTGLVGGEGWRLMPLEEIVEVWRRWYRDEPKDVYEVPIAHIGTGDFVYLDLDPNSEEPGCLMIQRRDTDERDPEPWMPSFSFWLEDFADELDAGKFVYSKKAGSVMYKGEADLYRP